MENVEDVKKQNSSVGSASEAAQPLKGAEAVLLRGVLLPTDGGYLRQDVLISAGLIAKIEDSGSLSAPDACSILDCRERMLLPGFVNAHTHSIGHWTKGLIKPLPMELMVGQFIQHEPRGGNGWHGQSSFTDTTSRAVGLSAMHCGVESLLSGCAAVLDHLWIRNLDDLAAAVDAYKAVGVRAFIAPMVSDDAERFINHIPLVPDAAARNVHCKAGGCSCGMGPNGEFRTEKSPSNPVFTPKFLQLLEEAVKRFHDPEGGIEIVIGPGTVYSSSEALLQGAAELRQKYNLCGHTHLLETRAQVLQARQWFSSGSAVKQLSETGFLQGRGTSLAHGIWLDDEEQRILAAAGAVLVHNPFSNLRLGSGIAPLLKFAEVDLKVAIGCDGSCCSDGQDMIEVLKLATFLPAVTTPEYRSWPTARHTALTLACKNGYSAIGLSGQGGELKEGMLADVSLWDLTSLALLPRTDPLSTLVMGSRTQASGAGSTLTDMWVRGIRVVQEGSPCGVDLKRLRALLSGAQQDYRDPDMTDPRNYPQSAAVETEYRAVMQLDGVTSGEGETFPSLQAFPCNRVLFDATLVGHADMEQQ